jgi:transcriptional regulator with XRE-family HTH domain
MDNFEEISSKIKVRRKILNYTQKELAELTNISERTIRDIENGEGSTSISSWYRILDILGLEMKITLKQMNNETRNSLL